MASTGQARAHFPQRMQRLRRKTTPPPLRWEKEPVGQASAQGAGLQARHTFASNPVDNPPEEAMRIPAVSQESRLYTNRAQAKEQEWQPIHLSIREAFRTFISNLRSMVKWPTSYLLNSTHYCIGGQRDFGADRRPLFKMGDSFPVGTCLRIILHHPMMMARGKGSRRKEASATRKAPKRRKLILRQTPRSMVHFLGKARQFMYNGSVFERRCP